MLGTLAKWLRILGYDTKYVKHMEDDEIFKVAKEEGRILITRDKMLSSKYEKSIYLENNGLKEQIEKVMEITGLKIEKQKLLTRCIICNEKVERIKKEEVKGRVPERVYNTHDEFYICPECHRIYWKGTHFENMEKFIRRLKIYKG